MNRSAERKVNIAATWLPRPLRERYREQWLGELRDAPEVGVQESDIARGAIVFTSGIARDIPGWSKASAGAIAQRLRWAVGLSLSGLTVALSQIATANEFVPATRSSDEVSFISAAADVVIAFAPIAAIVALALVLATKGAPLRTRIAVAISAITTLGFTVQSLIGETDWLNQHFIPRPFVYLAAAVLAVIVLSMLVRGAPATTAAPERLSRRLVASTVGGILIAATVVALHASAVALWARHTPLVFSDDVSETNRALFQDWVTSNSNAEYWLSDIFAGFLALGIIAAVLVAATGFLNRSTVRLSVSLSLGMLCVALLASGSVLAIVQFMLQNTQSSAGSAVPVHLVLLVARCALAVIVLVAVGMAGSRSRTAE